MEQTSQMATNCLRKIIKCDNCPWVGDKLSEETILEEQYTFREAIVSLSSAIIFSNVPVFELVYENNEFPDGATKSYKMKCCEQSSKIYQKGKIYSVALCL